MLQSLLASFSPRLSAILSGVSQGLGSDKWPLKVAKPAIALFESLGSKTVDQLTQADVKSVVALCEQLPGVTLPEGADERLWKLLSSGDTQPALDWLETSVSDGTFVRALNPTAHDVLVRCTHCDQPRSLAPEDTMPVGDNVVLWRCNHAECGQPNTLDLSQLK